MANTPTHAGRVGRTLSAAACSVLVAATLAVPLVAEAKPSGANAAVETRESQAEVVRRITSYCRSSWRNSRVPESDWDDCTQEVFARIYESLTAEQVEVAIMRPESDERRELNRAIWACSQRSRRQVRPVELQFDAPVVDETSDRWPLVEERRHRMRSAIQCKDARLTPTQRTILDRYSSGVHVADIASELQIAPDRVSDEKYKAIQKLKAFIRET